MKHTIQLTTPQLALTLLAVKGLAVEMCDPTHGWKERDRRDCAAAMKTLTNALYPKQQRK